MKYFAYLAIMVLLISVAALFYLQRPDGQAWLTSDGISSKSNQLTEQVVALSSNTFARAAKLFSETSQNIVGSIASDTSPQAMIIYRWQDEQGQWHYSDTPDPDGKSREMVLDPNDITVVAAEDTAILKGSAKAPSIGFTPTSVYDPVLIKKLFEDAEQVKSTLEQRSKALDATQ
ncbi:DUF4124 domain-containing protein [Pseudoalteromonas arctica]|uniref:DUF4124 domain-containing protein n=1 Tax=Pseudoalteromonas arctica TaxID=394751 RepID=A0A7Y0HAA9_9GAMM|nr:DUF4124 domain-containing protein [Pseudoalteromonas arctica]NMM40431.1 DUF4124 domain-containing protein [Pseudoalteromonas arctica]